MADVVGNILKQMDDLWNKPDPKSKARPNMKAKNDSEISPSTDGLTNVMASNSACSNSIALAVTKGRVPMAVTLMLKGGVRSHIWPTRTQLLIVLAVTVLNVSLGNQPTLTRPNSK